MPKVTIAILAYYEGGLLTEAIASALAQTYTDIKVVVYDDCSSYDLKKEVDAFNDPRLYYVRNEKNLGVWANPNKAMDLCDTEYLHIFHGDDIMFPWMIDECVSIMEDNSDIGIVATSYWFLEGSYPHPTERPERAGVLYGPREYIWANCKGVFSFGPLVSSTVLRKDILHRYNLRYRPDSGLADFNFFCEANHLGVSIYISKIPMVAWRKHSSSATSQAVEGKNAFNTMHDFAAKQNFLLSLDTSYVCSNVVKEQRVATAVVNAAKSNVTGEFLNELKCKFAKEGLNISDEVFAEAVTTGVVSRFARPLGIGEMSFGDYFKERQSCLERGLRLSSEKELQYFRMYIMPRRSARVMRFAAV
ncbi:MAG: glycosyltransferase family 2 protein [Synergistaceae bacterium]|nr:glycosyltransferase family 2 protein [Synergistaceae bacterium]